MENCNKHFMILNKKILILNDSIEYFNSYIEEYGFTCQPSFRRLNFFGKVFRKILFKVNYPKHIWFDVWKNKLSNFDAVIFFSTNSIEALEFIKNKNPNIKIIIWYWNPVNKSLLKPEKVKCKLHEFWTFDLTDSINYKLNINTNFYFKNILLPKNDLIYDVIFVGQDKGRAEKLNEYNCILNSLKLLTFFHVVDDYKHRFSARKVKPISYDVYLKKLAQSKVIFDYLQDGQTGLSLRPFESIFFNKKLITNNSNIKNYDFYRKENIFILNHDDISMLKSFVDSDYLELPKNIIDNYDFQSWSNRFFDIK